MRVVGADWICLKKGLNQQRDQLLSLPLAKMAMGFPVVYLDGVLSLEEEITVEEIEKRVAFIGMKIPLSYRASALDCLTYLERFGVWYLFQEMEPLLEEEIWVDPYLETKLKRGFTDFELLNRFPFLVSEEETRPEMIRSVMRFYRPAGSFWIIPGALIHELDGEEEEYRTEQAVISSVQEGVLRFRGRVCDKIGLQQLAYLMNPESWERLHGIEPTQEARNLHCHLLEQVRLSQGRTQ